MTLYSNLSLATYCQDIMHVSEGTQGAYHLMNLSSTISSSSMSSLCGT